MTCRRVRRLIPLAAGDDLRPRLAGAVRAHIDRCPGCRAELESFSAGLTEIKTQARAEGVADWTEAEWRAVVGRVAAEAKRTAGETGAGPGLNVRPYWAAAAVAGLLLGLVIMGALFKGPTPQRPGPEGQATARAVAGGKAEQDKLAIHMVSPESGLQVVWILDRNFNWKGDRE
jgi:anti-sigma factor RsiW